MKKPRLPTYCYKSISPLFFSQLPSDLDYHAFSKAASVYFRSHLWGMRRDPVQTPFLSSSSSEGRETEQDALALFRVILRFMNDEKLHGTREKVDT